MLKELAIFLSVFAYSFAFHTFIPSDSKKAVYTNFVPPSAERFFATAGAPSAAQSPQQIPTTASAKAVATPFAAAPSPPYLAPYVYQPQYPSSSFAFKQYPYYPGAFYPPQQYIYPAPAPIGPSPVYYVQRYPAPAESGSEQGGSASGSGWGSYFPASWPSFGSYFPQFLGGSGSGSSSESAEGASPATPVASSQASGSSSGNKVKPEKIESTEAPPAQDGGSKTEADKDTVQLPEQQYILLGQPQFFGQFAGFPADRDPTSLNDATKGAVSSFLFQKDQSQQIVPQKVIEIPNEQGIASVAYQRFLLLSKQRSEEGAKPTSQPEQIIDSQKNSAPQNLSNTTSANVAENSANQSSDGKSGDIARVTPNAVAYAGIGGQAGAAPIGTAFIASNGLASSAPRATAIAGTSDQTPQFSPVPAIRKISIARYTPQRKYHIDTAAGALIFE